MRKPWTDTPEASDFWPTWSPDGDTIAFRSNILAAGVARVFDVFTVNVEDASAEGDAYTQITTDGQNNHRPAWSPDGTSIAFDKARTLEPSQFKAERDLWIKPVEGGMSLRLTRGSDTNVGPVWRPDG